MSPVLPVTSLVAGVSSKEGSVEETYEGKVASEVLYRLVPSVLQGFGKEGSYTVGIYVGISIKK
jgi:hypothetical protein